MLSVERASKAFGVEDGRVVAVDDVTLAILPASYIANVGPSGSGKSTLLNMMGGLLPPDSGVVRVDGEDLYALSDEGLHRYRRSRVGLIFQDYNLISMLSVVENVSLPLELDGTPRRRARSRAEEMLAKLGLEGLTGRFPATLSGGQRQRVAVARAVVAGQEVVLADEPTGALDQAAAEQLMDLFDDVVDRGAAVVMVTHNEQLAARAQQIIRMADGAIIGREPADLEALPVSAAPHRRA
ncbi:ABC transporter ATP-binding protein [uncultured Serinicoccus sp.]|uniref:ABC transporter ATP-binding protein n=1 Tax=uncultured Serinicoccus sp. TaxID=735514 RepID=UPI0026267586|nr:ABC transporter ATP-binding protein [uncultured Serinicoccus sp.]